MYALRYRLRRTGNTNDIIRRRQCKVTLNRQDWRIILSVFMIILPATVIHWHEVCRYDRQILIQSMRKRHRDVGVWCILIPQVSIFLQRHSHDNADMDNTLFTSQEDPVKKCVA